MTPIWNYTSKDSPEFVNTFDELPLWSAPFGLLLLNHIPLKARSNVLDIGSGAGFPLFEIAERLGPSSRCYGLDPWTNANARATQKIVSYGVAHVEVKEGTARQMPFADHSMDLIVSNLGINNFEQPQEVFAECQRVLKPGGHLALTTNLNGHWREFYTVFEATLRSLELHALLPLLKAEQDHRGTVKSIAELFTGNGLTVTKVIEDSFTMRFLDGTAFLHHHFIQVGWLSSWIALIPEQERERVFTALETQLNTFAAIKNGLTLTVPMAYMEGEKKE